MGKIIFNYAKLKGRIIEKFGSQRAFAKACGFQESSLTLKLNGKRYFSQRDIFKMIEILCIDPHEVTYYFFTV